jgi:hypothetical protein
VLYAGLPGIRIRRKITKQVYYSLPAGFYNYKDLYGMPEEGKRKMRVLFTLLVYAGFLAVQQVAMSFFTDDEENNSKKTINYY